MTSILYRKNLKGLWQFRPLKTEKSDEELQAVANDLRRLKRKVRWCRISGISCIECSITDEEAQTIQEKYHQVVAHRIRRTMRNRGGEATVKPKRKRY